MNATWEKFCADLLEVGKVLDDEIVPQDPLTQAEGVRYLSRLLRYGTINSVEFTDPRWPSFTSAPNPNMMTKIGADNPDNVYMRANISGRHSYRIIGTRGTVPLITFGSRVNRYHVDGTMLQTGDLHVHDLEVDENGRFEFIASVDEPADGAGCRWHRRAISSRSGRPIRTDATRSSATCPSSASTRTASSSR